MLSRQAIGKTSAKIFWNRYNTDRNFRTSVLEKWRERRTKNYENDINKLVLHKGDLLNKSRLCGFLAADGSVFIRKEKKTGKIHYELRFYPDDDGLTKLFAESFKAVYGLDVHVKKDANYYFVYANNKLAVSDLLSLAKFSSMEWFVPSFISSKASKIEWLRAYFDCDGYVSKKYIQVQSVNKKGLEQMKDLLLEFGIESKIYSYERKQKSWNTNYMLNINGRKKMLKFREKIGFNHRLKKNKLEKILDAEVA